MLSLMKRSIKLEKTNSNLLNNVNLKQERGQKIYSTVYKQIYQYLKKLKEG